MLDLQKAVNIALVAVAAFAINAQAAAFPQGGCAQNSDVRTHGILRRISTEYHADFSAIASVQIPCYAAVECASLPLLAANKIHASLMPMYVTHGALRPCGAEDHANFGAIASVEVHCYAAVISASLPLLAVIINWDGADTPLSLHTQCY